MSYSPGLTNLREVGGAGLQARLRPGRRVVYRSNTEVVDADAYPASVEVVVDLRRDDEVEVVEHPLRDIAGYRRAPLFDPSSDLEAAADAITLEQQYTDWIVRHRTSIADAFRAVGAADGDVLVCCAAGKDRTGVVSAVLARLWGADLDTIGADYAATATALAESFRRDRETSTDLERTLVAQRCTPDVAIHLIETIEAEYCSVRGYLRWIGLSDTEIDRL